MTTLRQLAALVAFSVCCVLIWEFLAHAVIQSTHHYASGYSNKSQDDL